MVFARHISASQFGRSRHLIAMPEDWQVQMPQSDDRGFRPVHPDAPIQLTPAGREVLAWARSAFDDFDDLTPGA